MTCFVILLIFCFVCTKQCTACDAGHFKSADLAPDVCLACVAGKWAGEAASSDCTNCAAGKYKGSTVQTSDTCISCPTSWMHVTTVPGAVADADCVAVPGYTGSKASATICSAGTFKAAVGSKACGVCEAADAGETTCPCNVNEYGKSSLCFDILSSVLSH